MKIHCSVLIAKEVLVCIIPVLECLKKFCKNERRLCATIRESGYWTAHKRYINVSLKICYFSSVNKTLNVILRDFKI